MNNCPPDCRPQPSGMAQRSSPSPFPGRNIAKWFALTLLVGVLFAALAIVLTGSTAAGMASASTYQEPFTTTTYQDAARTTALWDTAAGQLRLHPPVPRLEGIAGQLFYASAWSPAVYVPDRERVYLFGGSNRPTVVQEYDPATNSTVRSSVVLPDELVGTAPVYVPSRQSIYLLGGNLSSTDIVVLNVDRMETTVLADKLPTPLAHAAAVYVPEQDKAYLFGGLGGDGWQRDTILEYDLSAGTVVTLPASLPISMSMSSAIYDPVTESAYIFGGQYFGVPFSMILRFDLASKELATAGVLPVASSATSAVHVPEQGKTYIFGGQGTAATAPLSQTVEYDIASNTATTLEATLLIERRGTAAVYVPSHGTAYVFGGESGLPGFPLALSDVLAFDVNARTATGIGAGVDDRSGASAVYVPTTGNVYLFGGKSGDQSASQSILGFNVDRARSGFLDATLPVSRTESAAVYDAARGQAYIFGGSSPGETTHYFADILRFDVVAEEVFPTGAALPSGRAGMAAAHVSAGRAYLFGGVGDSGCLDQILAYDPVQDRLTTLPSALPTAMAYASAVYDEVGNKIYLFGGWNPAAPTPYLDQIVAFDVASETATVLSARLPSRRAKAAAIGIPGEGTAYVMGGFHEQGVPLGDVLRFDAATGTLTAIEDMRLAYPRYAEAAVYVPQRAMALLFGGTGYYGLGDIVLLEFAYPLSERAQSLRVNAAGEEVHQALLRVNQNLRGGAVDYSLSNDGGQTWASVRPGMKHVFASAGSDLRWRAVLTGNGVTAPIVDSLSLTYNGIEQYLLYLPTILKGHR
jgi:N-acetylneuraminic acid mutarotase